MWWVFTVMWVFCFGAHSGRAVQAQLPKACKSLAPWPEIEPTAQDRTADSKPLSRGSHGSPVFTTPRLSWQLCSCFLSSRHGCSGSFLLPQLRASTTTSLLDMCSLWRMNLKPEPNSGKSARERDSRDTSVFTSIVEYMEHLKILGNM